MHLRSLRFQIAMLKAVCGLGSCFVNTLKPYTNFFLSIFNVMFVLFLFFWLVLFLHLDHYFRVIYVCCCCLGIPYTSSR